MGVNNFLGDVEVIKLANYFLNKLKIINKTILYINSLGDNESRFEYREKLVNYLEKFKNDLSEDSKVRLNRIH